VSLTREELIARLAEVSHRTYMKQKAEDLRRAAEEEVATLSPEVTDHDCERAEHIVDELIALGLIDFD
jgi:hypothetical protein